MATAPRLRHVHFKRVPSLNDAPHCYIATDDVPFQPGDDVRLMCADAFDLRMSTSPNRDHNHQQRPMRNVVPCRALAGQHINALLHPSHVGDACVIAGLALFLGLYTCTMPGVDEDDYDVTGLQGYMPIGGFTWPGGWRGFLLVLVVLLIAAFVGYARGRYGSSLPTSARG